MRILLELHRIEGHVGELTLTCTGCGDRATWNGAASQAWRYDLQDKVHLCRPCIRERARPYWKRRNSQTVFVLELSGYGLELVDG